MTKNMAVTGSCQCGRLRFEVAGPLGPVANCHCAFCRRIHGAAFTTVALVSGLAVSWLSSSAQAHRFTTPLGNFRHFCGACATPLWNSTPGGELAAVVVASLAEEHQPLPWMHVNVESRARWFTIHDALPQFSAWPTREELDRLLASHPGSWNPSQPARPDVLLYIEPIPGTAFTPDSLIALCVEGGASALLLDRSAIPAEFYDLSSRLAGDILHALSKYGLQLAAVIDDPANYSAPFREFVRESNSGPQFRFVPTRAEAITWLESGEGS